MNIPLLAVKEICDMKIPMDIDFDEGLVVSRYFEEAYFKVEEQESHGD